MQLPQKDPRDELPHAQSIVLYTNVDTPCTKVTTNVGRTKLTALATVDVLAAIFFVSPVSGTKFRGKSSLLLFWGNPNFLKSHSQRG